MNSTLKNSKNKHLTSSECHKLEILLKSKMKVKEIAKLLNRDWSIRQEYSGYYALSVRQSLMSKTGRKILYTELSSELLSYIQNKLKDK